MPGPMGADLDELCTVGDDAHPGVPTPFRDAAVRSGSCRMRIAATLAPASLIS